MATLIRMPKMSDTMQQGRISRWLKQVGDKVVEGDVLAEVETDKAIMELEAYEEGVLLYIGVPDQSSVHVNDIIAIIGEPGEDPQTLLIDQDIVVDMPDVAAVVSEAVQAVEPTVAVMPSSPNRIMASPLAKKIAQEKGYAVADIPGSGDAGRIVKQDVLRFISDRVEAFTAPLAEAYKDRPLSAMRQKMAKVLTECKTAAPHFYLTVRMNMHKVVALRAELNTHTETKISINDLMIKAIALALKRHPSINAAWLTDKIRLYEHVHIGVAVKVEEELVVPVMRFADQKSVVVISQEMKMLVDKGRKKQLLFQELQGATFTISNLGMFGIESFTAIINPPAACILAVGAVQTLPIVHKDQIVAAPMLKVTLSCDHRVVDGAVGALFLATLKELMEEPLRLLI